MSEISVQFSVAPWLLGHYVLYLECRFENPGGTMEGEGFVRLGDGPPPDWQARFSPHEVAMIERIPRPQDGMQLSIGCGFDGCRTFGWYFQEPGQPDYKLFAAAEATGWQLEPPLCSRHADVVRSAHAQAAAALEEVERMLSE